MDISTHLVVFTLAERRLALPLSAVERIVPAVEVTPLPQVSEMVEGIINFQGRVIPVLNIRPRFGLPERERELTDRFIIAATAARTVAVVAESVLGVVDGAETGAVAADDILSGLEYVDGVVKFEDELVLICSLDRLLSHEEAKTLDEALKP